MAPETPKILSVNVGGVRKFDYHGDPPRARSGSRRLADGSRPVA